MGLTLITPPATTPVDLAEAKAHCRVEDATEDALIESLIAAATDYVEQYTGKALMAQTWRLTLDSFADTIELPRNPVQSVAAVTYFDAAGDVQTLASDNYTVDLASDPAWVVINSDANWPDLADGVNMVRVDFVAGYTIVPASIKHAVLLLVGQWYDNRSASSDSAMTETPFAVEALLRSYRAMLV